MGGKELKQEMNKERRATNYVNNQMQSSRRNSGELALNKKQLKNTKKGEQQLQQSGHLDEMPRTADCVMMMVMRLI